MSLNALVRLPSSRTMLLHEDGGGLVKHSLFSTRKSTAQTSLKKQGQGHMLLVVQAKGKKGMQARQFQRPLQTPALPKIEDDGNPKFLIFIRAANVCSLSLSLSTYSNSGSLLLEFTHIISFRYFFNEFSWLLLPELCNFDDDIGFNFTLLLFA